MRTTKVVRNMKFGFDWQGGEYIEVCLGEAFKQPKEVINVWDSVNAKPELPFNRKNMHILINQWIEDYGRDALVHDALENWRYY